MTLRTEVNAVYAQYDPAQYDYLEPPADAERLQALLTTLLQQLHRDELGAQFFVDALRDQVEMAKVVAGLPPGFSFPASITSTISIRYDEPATALRLTGFLAPAQRQTLLNDPALAAVTGIAAYQDAIEEFFERPRLALKFFDPVFTAPLANLPPAVDFGALADSALAARVSYDPEARAVQVIGPLSADERDALDGLSGDPQYRNAINTLYIEPNVGVFPPERIWLQDADLTSPLTDNLNANLATAIRKALTYLATTSAESLVIQRVGAQLALSAGLTRALLSDYALLPETLLAHLTGAFAATAGAVDYTTLKPTFDGWYWANRVATLWKRWNLTLAERDQLRDLAAAAQLLDFAALPLDDAAPRVSLDRVLRTSRLIRLKASLPETNAKLLDVLETLHANGYAAPGAFAADVERLNDAWHAVDVEGFVDALDLVFPADYLLVESWERLRRAFYFADSLNAGAAAVRTFAAATMTKDQAQNLKELLRSGLGVDTWLPLSTEIQDQLRERKRDALAAYLLASPEARRRPDRQVGEHQRPLRLLPARRRDVGLPADQPPRSRAPGRSSCSSSAASWASSRRCRCMRTAPTATALGTGGPGCASTVSGRPTGRSSCGPRTGSSPSSRRTARRS